jgi:hypothetical protein
MAAAIFHALPRLEPAPDESLAEFAQRAATHYRLVGLLARTNPELAELVTAA